MNSCSRAVIEAGGGRPLRVLFILPSLAGGGAERVILSLVRHLDRARFQPVLAVVDGRPSDHSADVPADIALIDLRCRRLRYALPALARLLWRTRPDVMLSTLGHLNLGLAMLRPLWPGRMAGLARETIVVSEELRHRHAPRIWYWMYARFYRRYDAVVCQSQDMQRDLVRHFNLEERRTARISNPVDIARVRELAGAPGVREPGVLRMVAAGRLVPQKGFDLLIGALAALDDRSVRLTILGDGPLREALAQQAAEQGVADRVCFAGRQFNPFPCIAGADVFVLASRFEGFPNVVLEALACGTPVVALPAPGGVREILDGVPQCVVADAVTQEALAAALRRWMEGDRCRVPATAVECYGVDRVVAQYQQLFERVAAPRAAARTRLH